MSDKLEFLDFVNYYVESGRYEFQSPFSAKIVSEYGFSGLPANERLLIQEEIYQLFSDKTCSVCKEVVRWSELYEFFENGGKCGHCDYKTTK